MKYRSVQISKIRLDFTAVFYASLFAIQLTALPGNPIPIFDDYIVGMSATLHTLADYLEGLLWRATTRRRRMAGKSQSRRLHK